jgi:hypothetical protein
MDARRETADTDAVIDVECQRGARFDSHDPVTAAAAASCARSAVPPNTSWNCRRQNSSLPNGRSRGASYPRRGRSRPYNARSHRRPEGAQLRRRAGDRARRAKRRIGKEQGLGQHFTIFEVAGQLLPDWLRAASQQSTYQPLDIIARIRCIRFFKN